MRKIIPFSDNDEQHEEFIKTQSRHSSLRKIVPNSTDNDYSEESDSSSDNNEQHEKYIET